MVYSNLVFFVNRKNCAAFLFLIFNFFLDLGCLIFNETRFAFDLITAIVLGSHRPEIVSKLVQYCGFDIFRLPYMLPLVL